MNVTLNTSISHNQYNVRKQNPSFNGSIPRKSAFLKPFNKGYDKLVDKLTEYYEAPMYSNKLANWFSHRDDIGRIVDHMQTIGSFIVTGMYMLQTLRNQNMDEKRKKTLAINQGLTLLASTAIAHLVSEKLVGPWNKHVSMKYAANKLECSQDELAEKLKEHQEKIKKQYIKKHPEDVDLKKFKKPNLIHYVEKGLKDEILKGKLKGLDVLKSLIIFGSVYRFFGPVAVTPVANWIGNKLFYSGETKTKAEEKADLSKQDVKSQDVKDFQMSKIKLEKFLGNLK